MHLDFLVKFVDYLKGKVREAVIHSVRPSSLLNILFWKRIINDIIIIYLPRKVTILVEIKMQHLRCIFLTAL